ncbi:MAG: hypothetical protein LBG82_07890 [Clostridiales Family XIII bacterium]|nr:hypothetical protein [Clostridiales Family XIII bacterium]
MDITFESVVSFLVNYFVLFLLGGAAVLAVARIVYNVLRPNGKDAARRMARDVANIYDPLTGMPRNVLGKEPPAYEIEVREWGDAGKEKENGENRYL